jgi:hypothetical protein
MYQIVKASNRALAWCEIVERWVPVAEATVFPSLDVAHDAAEMFPHILSHEFVTVRCV